MTIRQQFVPFVLLLTVLMTDATASSFNREVLDVTDTNPDPDVFEASLVATEQNVMIDGQLVLAMFYKDENNPGAYPAVPDGIPVPQILVDVGEEVVIHFRNDFPTRDDNDWMKHTLAFRTEDGGHELRYKPVTVTKYQPEERKY